MHKASARRKHCTVWPLLYALSASPLAEFTGRTWQNKILHVYVLVLCKYVCLCERVCTTYAGPCKARRGHWILWDWVTHLGAGN